MKESLLSEILVKPGTIRAEYNDAGLTVEYDFPETCFTQIWQSICVAIDPSQLSLVERLINSVTGLAEENEREHILNPSHWHTYVRDVYVHYFDYRHIESSDARKQLWRRYQLKS